MARILDFYAVRWEYEPHTFPILWNLEGDVVESFSPDFCLPDLDLYLEMTTLRQKLVRKKNRKLRRLRELYPDINIKLFYARDFRALMLKYGKLALVARPVGDVRPGRLSARHGGRSSADRDAPMPAGRRRRPSHRRASDTVRPAASWRVRPRGARVDAPVAVDRRTVDPLMTHPVDLHADIGEILLTEEQIAAKVRELGARISADHAGRPLTLVSVLKGSLPFMADLMRAIDIPVRIDLMEVSSYGGTATESSGLVRILKDLSASIEDEDVLIVEDIIDTGLTLNYLIRYLRGKRPEDRSGSARCSTSRPGGSSRSRSTTSASRSPTSSSSGYGLDYGELYRNLRYVGVLGREVYRGSTGRDDASPAARAGADAGRHRRDRSSSSAASCRGGRSAATPGIPPQAGNGFAGSGIVVFLVGLAMLALLALPVRGRRPSGRRSTGLSSFALLALVGWIALRVADRRPRPDRGVPVQPARPACHERPGSLGHRAGSRRPCPRAPT